ncbi:MAG: AAA family ATPase [Deltaproteobacteria bacterium]|nr:AAA family ATPase [Deltaproteobacteria bacterium]
MYTSFFGFKEKPFNLTPDPKYLFLSHYHKEALDHLLYGINERKGFVAVTGGIGTGKTTLCRALLSNLDSSTKSALIFNSFISDRELLKVINQEFGIEMGPGAESKKDYIDALNHFLLENFSKGGNAVLLIDEAQNLSHSVLEQIRMLSNLETEKEKLIQIILVGQPELKELLIAPSLRQLDERITVRYDLRSLDSNDIKGYVEHRLVVAGSKGNVRFTKGALKKIFSYSRGNPRRINAVCDRALLIAYTLEKHTLSQKMLVKAINEVRGNMVVSPWVTDLSRRRPGLTALFAALLIMAAGFFGWTFKKDILRLFPKEEKITEIETRHPPGKPAKLEEKASSLFLDESTSLTWLFKLSNATRTADNYYADEVYLNLVSLNVGPEWPVMFKKPFRVQLSSVHSSSLPLPRYLLIRELTYEGAVAIDAEGRDQAVSRDFVLRNWGLRISWFFPYKSKDIILAKGMNSPDVLEVQRILHKVGYLVEPTGVFDESTFHEVARFQKDFGLVADGIVGPRTRAVLYLMS